MSELKNLFLIILSCLPGAICVYFAVNYYFKKKQEANDLAENIIREAQAKANDIIREANAEKEKFEKKIKEMEQAQQEFQRKQEILRKEKQEIERKMARQNKLFNSIKHVLLSEKKHQYDLKKRLRYMLMEYENQRR